MQTMSLNAVAAAVKGAPSQAAAGDTAGAAPQQAGGDSVFGALLASQLKGGASATAPALPLDLLSAEQPTKGDAAKLVLEITPDHPMDPNALAGLVAQALAGLNTKQADTRAVPTGEVRTASKIGDDNTGKAAKDSPLPLATDAGTDKPLPKEEKAAVIAESGKMLPAEPVKRETHGAEIKEILPAEQFGDKLVAAQQALAHSEPAKAVVSAADSQASRIDRPVGAPGWGGELGQKVVWMVGQQKQTAELQLNPPNLGPLEVRLSLNQDQMTATFVSHHAAVRDAIEAAMPRLRDMLADNGIALGNVMVGAESFAQQQQQQQQAAAQQNGQGKGQDGFSLSPSSEAEGAAVAGTVRIERNGLVNTFV